MGSFRLAGLRQLEEHIANLLYTRCILSIRTPSCKRLAQLREAMVEEEQWKKYGS